VTENRTPSNYEDPIVPGKPDVVDITRAKVLTPRAEQQIDDMFEYHRWTDEQVEHGKKIRQALADAVKIIIEHVPPSPDRSAAIRKIREARMDCNSAITHNGKY
jgi:hypothetical protein